MSSSTRLPPIADAAMTPEQLRVATDLRNGPRRGLPGPFHALLRRPVLAERVRLLGDYVRFESALEPALRELAIMLVARHWCADYEWQAHRRLGREAGLDPSIADAIEARRRPAGLTPDQELVYEVVHGLLAEKDIPDPIYAAAVARFGEGGLVDLVCTAGYYGFVSMILNTVRMPPPEGTGRLPRP